MKKIYIILILLLFWSNSQAQCFMNRHSTNWYDGWISCETSANPNSLHGDSHWIMYDFGFVYPLFQSTIWNTNEPNNLDYGMQDYIIDYSVNGTTWTNFGTFTLNQASGFSIYEGEDGPDFGGINARYILITPTSNYGGNCYGFSEIKFNLDGNLAINDTQLGYNVVIYPNPFNEYVNIKINTMFSNEPINYSLYDILGREILSKTLENQSQINTITIPTNNLTSGIYFIKILHNNKQKSFKIIKN